MAHIYSHFLKLGVLPLVGVLTDSQFWNLYKSFQGGAPMDVFDPPPDSILRRLTQLVEHARTTVPFYRDLYSSLSSPSFDSTHGFQQLPSVRKADITANFPDRISSSVEQFPPWRYRSTSGTTERLTAIHDYRKREMVRASQLLALNSATSYQPGMKYLEIPPNICRNVCGLSNTREPGLAEFVIENLRTKKVLTPSFRSDLKGLIERQWLYRQVALPSYGAAGYGQFPEDLDAHLRAIEDYRPSVVKALPAYLYALAIHIVEERRRPPRIPRGLSPMGGSLSTYMKRVVESAFECPVHEDYGSAEFGAIAAECGSQNGLHLFRGLFHVEVLRGNRPAAAGELGKVVITDLYNYAMPFIRYEIGDSAVFRSGRCLCGRETMRLEVHGRVRDCLPGKDGEVITPDQIADLVLSQRDVFAFQLEVSSHWSASLRIVPRRGRTPDLKTIAGLIADRIGISIQSKITPTIQPEPGGKFRFVKNLTDSGEQLFR
jgi:phenylacetate-CoA ligase